jgi:predicted dehydrogenase
MSAVKGIALIGAGMVARTYVEAIAGLPGLRIAGVLTQRPGTAAAFIDTQGLDARPYATLADLVTDPALAFAILITPPNARSEAVAALVAAELPILMEKPVERTLAAATTLVEACEAARLPLGIMLQQRARPSVAALRARLARGDFGALRLAEIRVPWWRPQGYYDEPGRGSYARDGGGVMISQAIHTMDLALQFTGPVARVTAMTATTGLHRMEAEDTVIAGLELASGAPACLFASTAAHPGSPEEIVLHYDRASARLSGAALTITPHDGPPESFGTGGGTGSGADPMAFTADWHRAVIADFAAALDEGRPPMIPGRSALPVHALIEAIETASRDGRRIDL